MGILDYIPEQYQTIRNYGNFFPMQQPQNGTDMVNGSFAEEAVKENQKHQQNLIDAAREEAIRQDPEILNHVQREIAKGLLGNKIAYHAAEGAGNIPGMTQAQMAADSLRKQGESIGWDGRGYGADVSLQDAAQNLANNDTMAINKLFYNTQTPNAYYNQQYDHLREIGVSKKRAEEEATRRTDVYLEQTANNMLDAFHTYGTDDSGVINPNGLRILSMMGMGGNSEIANFLAKMNPSPVQGWNYGNSLRAAEMADKNKRDYLGLQYAYGQKGADAQMARTKDMAVFNANLAREREMQMLQQRAALADELGYSGEDKRSYVLTGKLPSPRSGSGSKSQGDNTSASKALKERYERLKDWIERYEKSHANDEDTSWKNNPEYLQRIAEFDSFTANQTPNVNDMISNAEIKGYSREEVIEGLTEYLIDSEGYTKQKAESEAKRYWLEHPDHAGMGNLKATDRY